MLSKTSSFSSSPWLAPCKRRVSIHRNINRGVMLASYNNFPNNLAEVKLATTKLNTYASRHFSTVRSVRPKIGLVGAGQIGAMLGVLSGIKHLGDVCMYDIMDGIPQGKALDLEHFSAVENVETRYTGTSDLSDLAESDVVIVTAGVPRKPGMTRDDLRITNAKVIRDVGKALKQYCPNAFVICITNPLDAMVQLLQKESGIPTQRVVGMAGVLDSARFRYFLAEKLGVSASDVQTLTFGSHGDTMVFIPRYTTVGGINLSEFVRMGWLTDTEINDIIKRARNSGGEIVSYLKNGSAFFAPAAGAIKMAEAYLRDKKTLISCAAYLDGEFGIQDLYVGVPVIIGGHGVERVIELQLTPDEEKEFQRSVNEVRTLVHQVTQPKP